jgi:hypothetical protein
MRFKSILLSSLRIYATFGIFLFHILGLYGFNNHHIDFFSIVVFCFLSGLLSCELGPTPSQWLIKKAFKILIPYWLVIIPVLLINRILCYKDTSNIQDFITLLGGNMFLDNKVYVIAWYITFILLLYLFIYFQSFFNATYLKLIAWLIGLLFFGVALNKLYYFLAFGSGFFLSKIMTPLSKEEHKESFVSRILFDLQKYCYYFFLIHGGILIFLFNILKLNFIQSFLIGFLMSVLGGVALSFLTTFSMKKYYSVI